LDPSLALEVVSVMILAAVVVRSILLEADVGPLEEAVRLLAVGAKGLFLVLALQECLVKNEGWHYSVRSPSSHKVKSLAKPYGKENGPSTSPG